MQLHNPPRNHRSFTSSLQFQTWLKVKVSQFRSATPRSKVTSSVSPNPSSLLGFMAYNMLGNCIACKRFAIQTFLLTLEFVIHRNLEYDTITVSNLAQIHATINLIGKNALKNWRLCMTEVHSFDFFICLVLDWHLYLSMFLVSWSKKSSFDLVTFSWSLHLGVFTDFSTKVPGFAIIC